jgi:hypothetical protein
MITGLLGDSNGIIAKGGVDVQIPILVETCGKQIDTPLKHMGNVYRGTGHVPPISVPVLKETTVSGAAYKSGVFVRNRVV